MIDTEINYAPPGAEKVTAKPKAMSEEMFGYMDRHLEAHMREAGKPEDEIKAARQKIDEYKARQSQLFNDEMFEYADRHLEAHMKEAGMPEEEIATARRELDVIKAQRDIPSIASPLAPPAMENQPLGPATPLPTPTVRP